MTINFMSSKNNNEEHVMHSKSDHIEIMINEKVDEVIEKPFQSLPSRYQIGLETPMKGSDFIFDCVYLLYHKRRKTNTDCGVSYIDFADWIKNKKATINPIYEFDNNCFQYATTLALNDKEIGKDSGRMKKINFL